MKVIVTGCAGLIGSNFCDYLVNTFPEMEVIGIDNLSGGFIEHVNEGITFMNVDLTKKEDQVKKGCISS